MSRFPWPWGSQAVIHSPWLTLLSLGIGALLLSGLTWARRRK